jgi:hypothetical protein
MLAGTAARPPRAAAASATGCGWPRPDAPWSGCGHNIQAQSSSRAPSVARNKLPRRRRNQRCSRDHDQPRRLRRRREVMPSQLCGRGHDQPRRLRRRREVIVGAFSFSTRRKPIGGVVGSACRSRVGFRTGGFNITTREVYPSVANRPNFTPRTRAVSHGAGKSVPRTVCAGATHCGRWRR